MCSHAAHAYNHHLYSRWRINGWENIPFLWKAEIFAAHQEQWLWGELQHEDLEQSGPEDLVCNDIMRVCTETRYDPYQERVDCLAGSQDPLQIYTVNSLAHSQSMLILCTGTYDCS